MIIIFLINVYKKECSYLLQFYETIKDIDCFLSTKRTVFRDEQEINFSEIEKFIRKVLSDFLKGGTKIASKI